MAISVDWETLRDFSISKIVSVQWTDFNGSYFISAFDGPVGLSTVLSQHDPLNLDLRDFEDNFKNDPNANTIIRDLIVGDMIDHSGTTSATIGESTEIMPTNKNRRYLLVQNLEAAGDIFINLGNSASLLSPGSIMISPFGSYILSDNFISSQSINIAGEFASMRFTAKER